MSTILANNLLTQQFDMKTSQYKMVQQNPQSGASTATISQAGGQQVVFEIPPSAYNWSKSRLDFSMVPAAGGATFYNYIHTDGFTFIRTMKLTTRTGVEIFTCDDVAKLTNMLTRRKLLRSKAHNLEYPTATTFSEGASVLKKMNGDFLRPTSNTAQTRAGECTYLWPVSGTANGATPVASFSYLFGLLFETIFEEDKTLFLGNDVLYLTITFHQSSIIMHKGITSGAEPATGVANYTGDIAVSGLKLWLAQDTNMETVNMLKSKVASAEGMRVLFKQPIYNKMSLSSTSQTASVKYNSALGKRLKAIYHGIYNGTESTGTQFDHDNLADAKCAEYYVTINNVRTTDQNIDTSAFIDYKFYKERHDGACIVDADDYYYNWIVETNLGAPLSVIEREQNNPTFDNILEGVPLDQEIKYDFVGVTMTNATYNHYIFGVVIRELLINSSGISVVN